MYYPLINQETHVSKIRKFAFNSIA